ncbi:O-antigen ligase family protein [Herbaspirillum sp. WKF16]|jgi:O-antigen ligase|uniref:O-antigen ligase family protein n=1 Tax=Herbaspirillum sp. WKF16 TaxID=3028312 RepID=UPI0023A9F2DC|nr:O-antigen ligase family protein [Herbaspirillum sp. WKF16]WDZ95090.1 O-antigen ligase family protein [Herbaspirillum sp. WKF16]
MNRFTSFAVFLYSAISLIVPSGFSVGSGLLVLGSVVLLERRRRAPLSREDRALIAVFLFYFAVSVGMNLLHHEIVKEYDLPLRFLLAVPALLLLRAYPPAPGFFWGGLAVGGMLAGLFAGYQNLGLHIERAGGHTNPIQYGNISFIIGMLSLAGIGWALRQDRSRSWIVALTIGGVMGLLGSLFTGSRGSWMAFPFCLLALYACYGGEIEKRHVWRIVGVVLAAAIVVFAVPRTGVRERAELAWREAAMYMKNKNAETSIGTRMEMWRTGYLAAADSPLLGMGKAGFVAWESAQIDAGRIDPFMRENNHVYNEWLDAVVKRGLPGLAALLLLYFVPLRYFFRRFRSGAERARPYAVGGIILIINYICFGFSQVFMAHNTGVMTLGFTTVILWALLRAEEERSAR